MKQQYIYVVIQMFFDEEYGFCYSSAEVSKVFIGEDAEKRADAYCEEQNKKYGNFSHYSSHKTEVD